MIDNEKKLELTKLADDMRKRSYCPYSGFAVGAAVLTSDGKIFTGCNVENAAFGPSICAERVAISKAVSEGHRSFVAIAIAGGRQKEPIVSAAPPCGVCRQVMREFSVPSDFLIIMAESDGRFREACLDDLLPDSFGPDNL